MPKIIYPISPNINGGIHSKGKKDLNENFDVINGLVCQKVTLDARTCGIITANVRALC